MRASDELAYACPWMTEGGLAHENTSVPAPNLCSRLQHTSLVLLISACVPSISASRGVLITFTSAHVFRRVGPRPADLAATIHKATRSCEDLLRVSRMLSLIHI